MLRPRELSTSPGPGAAVARRCPGAYRLPGAGAALLVVVATAACAGPFVPAEWTVDLVEEVTIGADPVGVEAAFYNPSDLGFDFRRRVFVLDGGNHRVQVFDSTGDFDLSLGGYGQGPGQLDSPMGMWVHSEGSVVVADTGNRRLQPFGASGAALASIPLDYAPLDVVGSLDRMFVLRLPRATMFLGPDKRALIQVLDRRGAPLDALIEPTPSDAGFLYLMENSLRLSTAPPGGFAVANTHFSSRIRTYDPSGSLRREIPVLYKAGAWAPLGQRPPEINETSLEQIARTCTDLAWDPVRRVFWVLAGYVDQTPEGEWIAAHELYRYAPDGTYRGSAMLPFQGVAVGAGPDGRIWVIDAEGVVHGFRVEDPDMVSLIDRRGSPG